MRQPETTITILVAILLLLNVSPCNANKELPRSLEEMQSASEIVLDGAVTDVITKKKPTSSNEQGDTLDSDDHEATFKIERTLKGKIRDKSVFLVYSRIVDPRFEGDNPPVLKVGDRFRLFADKVEGIGPPVVIRIRSINAVRPEAINSNKYTGSVISESPPLAVVAPPTALKKPPESKPKGPTPSPTLPPGETPTSSTPWTLIVILIVAASGLLWLLLERRP